MAALDRLACLLSAHRWTKPFFVQFPTCRVVSRYCTRCDATTHTVQDVWDDPTRDFARSVQSWLDGRMRQGGVA